ncbi:OmpA family protein [Streptomyces alkaliphilus]|uniref:OmpA family protein n=1 Tax=Streptomyces alkaliphilus TaxID=1472722 RepID=UPI0011813448|nr:OmpA family protein [Streptomyces alkaliphilus]MQS07967.1 OmpA family protein [Streptomyces alkaliphilus]
MRDMRVTTPGRAIAVTAVTAVALGIGAPAFADENGEYEQPPGYEAPAPPQIDANAPGLMLGDGATLAEPRVLDIKFVIEDTGAPPAATPQPENPSPPAGGVEDEEEPPAREESPDPDEGTGVDGGGETREERTGNQRKFTLQTDVIFGKDSDVVSDEAREALAVVAEAIAEHSPAEVNVFGFTDNLGSYEHGVTLSNNRARNTQQVLVELLDDPSGINFNVRGYSEDYPLYDNSTEEGRQKNRRVEISWPSS